MIKEYLGAVIFLMLLLGFVSLNYLSVDKRERQKAVETLLKITKFTEPSWSVIQLGQSIRFHNAQRENSVYPEMLKIDYLDYIYAR